jgi:pimeloyl-ACP methyl ester carboxylesterase
MIQGPSMAVVLLLAGCAAPRPLQLEPCRVPEVEETLRCGSLAVPEDWSRPEGRKITLNVLVIPALQPDPARPPLFELAGGPGMAAAGAASFYTTAGRLHREKRDVVLVDQRGTGGSGALRCADLERRHPLLSMYPLPEVRRCRESLQGGADLSQYTTEASAADLEAVRAALGYPRLDLWALSYGTRLARAYMRRHPERVHAAVLVGTVGDDKKLPLWHARGAQDVVDRVFEQCAHDAPCARAFPGLQHEWARLLRRLDEQPVTVEVETASGKAPMRITRGPFDEALRSLLVTTAGQRRLPFLVHEMSSGRFGPFLKSLTPGGAAPGLAEGLYLSVTCAEDTQWISSEEREHATRRTFLGTYRVDEQAGACREWGVPKMRGPAGAPSSSDVPVLFFAGGLDYVTPPGWTTEVVKQFSRGRVVSVPDLGHFPDGLSHMECLDNITAEFFARGDARDVDVACVSTMLPPPFLLAEER